MSEEEKCCLTCRNLQFGFSSDRGHSWDICDYVCRIEDESGVCIETLLLCTHGLDSSLVRRILKELGRDCSNWIRRD